MALKQDEISDVIPAFNEEQAISIVVADLKKLSIVTEIIVIADGLMDFTRQKAIESGAIVLSDERNRFFVPKRNNFY